LSGDEIAVHHHVRLKVSGFGINAAVTAEHVFDEKRRRLREANRLFFGIAEARDFLAINQRRAVRGLDIAQGARRVANGSHRLVRRAHALDQTNGSTVLCKVPQRAVTPRVEHCLMVGRGNGGELDGMGELLLGNSVRAEPTRGLGLGACGFAPRIHWRLATERASVKIQSAA
jgi:hypothetical protein